MVLNMNSMGIPGGFRGNTWFSGNIWGREVLGDLGLNAQITSLCL